MVEGGGEYDCAKLIQIGTYTLLHFFLNKNKMGTQVIFGGGGCVPLTPRINVGDMVHRASRIVQ